MTFNLSQVFSDAHTKLDGFIKGVEADAVHALMNELGNAVHSVVSVLAPTLEDNVAKLEGDVEHALWAFLGEQAATPAVIDKAEATVTAFVQSYVAKAKSALTT